MAIIEPRGFRFSVDPEGFSSDEDAVRAIEALQDSLSRRHTVQVYQLHEALLSGTQAARASEIMQSFAREAIDAWTRTEGITGPGDGVRLKISAA